jgi:TPR repeat protein
VRNKNLGKKYHEGIGVPQDYVQAYKWFSLSASNEEGKNIPKSVVSVTLGKGQLPDTGSDIATESVQFRNSVAAIMTPGQVAAAQQLTRKWQPKENTCVRSD